ncbi:MAG: dihydroxyacetone kinase subunit L [Eubacterium sp.]|nr:dihydroxyacetone kinase subunit L [Eubacterium sp.]
MAITEIKAEELPALFESVAEVFEEKKELLCQMDAAMGDGDLGLTMSKGYGALPQILRENLDADNPAKMLMKGGMKMSGVVPSTMGTLMSSGLMQGGKMLNGRKTIGASEFADFLTGFAEGIKKRGKCDAGDRTIYDVLEPAQKAAQQAASAGASLPDVAAAALQGAEAGVEATKEMIPRFGKAAVHAAKAKGVEDQGAVAGKCLIEGLLRYIN